ncbi:MAG: S8 family serine peptidase [Acidobacteria bacterium]|nr:S8 family serine peptidase [Acidobacteriota bacterium]
MSRISIAAVCFVVCALLIGVTVPRGTPAAAAATTAGPGEATNFVPGEVLIRFKPSGVGLARASALAELNALPLKKFPSGAEHWKLGPGVSVEDAIGRMSRRPGVEYAEPNYYVVPATIPNDPNFGNQWGLRNTGQAYEPGVITGTPDADIDADLAWNAGTGSSSVVVAVVDSGIDYNHPDLAANIWTNQGESGGGKETNGIDDDQNGYVDDVHGYDFGDGDGNPIPYPAIGSFFPGACPFMPRHGTLVAGLIGAVGNNGIGIAGVSWNVKLMALKNVALGESAGTVDRYVNSINYARTMGANIIDASWEIPPPCPAHGTGICSQTLYDAINAAGLQGIAFVASSGNNGNDEDALAAKNRYYPAAYDLANVIAVAGSDPNDALYGNYGATVVDLAAPGVNMITTTWNPVFTTDEDGCTLVDVAHTYEYDTGTSMAAPIVAGTAALLRAIKPTITLTELKSVLLASAERRPSLQGKMVSNGRLNANCAVAKVSTSPADADLDGVPDACDYCPSLYNPSQTVGAPVAQVLWPNGSTTVSINEVRTITWTASETGGCVPKVDLLLSRSGSGGPFQTIALGVPNTGSYNWTVTGPTTTQAFLKVVAQDPAMFTGSDLSNAAWTIQPACGPCVVSYCAGEGSRCTFNDTCGAGGCCNYTCAPDATCGAPDPCPSGACSC